MHVSLANIRTVYEVLFDRALEGSKPYKQAGEECVAELGWKGFTDCIKFLEQPQLKVQTQAARASALRNLLEGE